MDKSIVLMMIEIIAGVILEGVILGFIFQQISHKSQEQQRQNLQTEMNNIEIQNRKNTELIQDDLKDMKNDIISQIKESEGRS